MDDQLTINDLPIECVDEILKWITDRIDRMYARFVCKLWCALIDRDCSAELFLINNPHGMIRTGYNSLGLKKVELSKIFLPHFTSQRKKTTFCFRGVDLKGIEQFWKIKGSRIISLKFGVCDNIPFEEIFEHCSFLKTLKILFKFDKRQELSNVLENYIARGKKNFSVQFIHLSGQSIENVISLVGLISQVFFGVKNVFFEVHTELDWVGYINSCSIAFKNLKFVITLSNYKFKFVFDPSSEEDPVKMTYVEVRNAYRDVNGVPVIPSHGYCLKHLNKLHLQSHDEGEPFRLDHLQYLFTQCPTLKSICVEVTDGDFIPLTNPSGKNNIEYLSLINFSKILIDTESHVIVPESYGVCPIPINDEFFQSFENIKTFECGELLFGDFVKLLRKLPNLEKLKVTDAAIEFVVDPDPESDDQREQTISSGRLIELQISPSFLLKTIAKYDFSNLRTLNFCTKIDNPEVILLHDMDEQLKRMHCPKLEILQMFSFPWGQFKWNGSDQDELTQWILNILALYPRLTEFVISWFNDIVIHRGLEQINWMKATDEIMKILLANHRRLKKIGADYEPHILNILSPWYIKHRCAYGESVLYIP